MCDRPVYAAVVWAPARTSHDATRRLIAQRAVVIATGSRASLPPVEGLRDARTWDNRAVTTAKEIPARLLILGGGVVGVEMAQAYRRLGAGEVTIIEMADRILTPYEPWVSELLTEALTEDGIAVRTGVAAQKVTRRSSDGPVTVTLADGGELEGHEVLVAAGRTFNTDDIGLEAIGLEPGGPLEVDDRLRVRGIEGSWLYAAGDVNGRALLTHQGKYQARLIGDIVAGRDRQAWADHVAVPQVVFTDPEIAAVGKTQAQARDEGLNVKVVDVPISSVAGASLTGEGVRGHAQLVLDQDHRVVVGATFVGPHVGEVLHSATVAIVGQVPVDTLWHAVPAFPTVSEVWLRLLEADRGV